MLLPVMLVGVIFFITLVEGVVFQINRIGGNVRLCDFTRANYPRSDHSFFV